MSNLLIHIRVRDPCVRAVGLSAARRGHLASLSEPIGTSCISNGLRSPSEISPVGNAQSAPVRFEKVYFFKREAP